jgi:YfiH family protein
MPTEDNISILQPDWPAPAHIKAFVTTRHGGVSQAPFHSLNLGTHVGDDLQSVLQNRQRVQKILNEKIGRTALTPQWLNQVHGTTVMQATEQTHSTVPDADASTTQTSGLPCVVMTADCLPVLFCDEQGQQVAAAHAGWRGLEAGILEATVATFAKPQKILAWLGPAIGPSAFEVGTEVREAFLRHDAQAEHAFHPSHRVGHYLADIYALAKLRLKAAGVDAIYGGNFCTYTQQELFFSYRREGKTGRMAAFILKD